MTRSPIQIIIDEAMRCTICGAKMNTCCCWNAQSVILRETDDVRKCFSNMFRKFRNGKCNWDDLIEMLKAGTDRLERVRKDNPIDGDVLK